MSEYINLNELIKDKIEEEKPDPFNTLENINTQFNQNLSEETLNKIYQVQIINNSNKIIIKHVGNFKERPTIVINKFKFKKYDINIVNYLLLDIDLEEIKSTNICKIFGINIIENGEIKYIIQLICRLNNFNEKILKNLIDINLEVEPEIIFIKSTGEKEKLGSLNIFPENNNNLFELLTKELLNPIIFNDL